MKKQKGPVIRGRAAPRGTVTRRSLLVRRSLTRVKPLPLHLQVLPQRMKRIPRHTGCAAFAPGINEAAARLLLVEPVQYFRKLCGLEVTQNHYKVTTHYGIGYTDSLRWACAWQIAATMRGVWSQIDENTQEAAIAP